MGRHDELFFKYAWNALGAKRRKFGVIIPVVGKWRTCARALKKTACAKYGSGVGDEIRVWQEPESPYEVMLESEDRGIRIARIGMRTSTVFHCMVFAKPGGMEVAMQRDYCRLVASSTKDENARLMPACE